MLENIRLSFQGVWSHRLRSFLTMLGIIIGIAAIIAIVSTIKGTNEQIKKNLIGSGTNTTTVQLTESGNYPAEMEYGIPKGIPVLDDAMREQLAELSHVKDASLYMSRTQVDYIYYNSTVLSGGQLIGADSHYLGTCGYVMKKGRGFTESDYEKYRKVAVVDSVAADSLFGNENPVGKTIDIKGEPFIVVGVIEESTAFSPVINSVEDYYTYVYNDGSASGIVVIPDVDWNIVQQYDEPQNAKLLADSTDNMTSVGKAAQTLLNETVTNKDIKYRAANINETAEESQQVSATTNKQLIWIASISLLVCWWYRCYEYYACIRNRAYKRNRFEKGNRCEKESNTGTVLNRSSSTDQSWRYHWYDYRYCISRSYRKDIKCSNCNQYTGSYSGNCIFYNNRSSIWITSGSKSS